MIGIVPRPQAVGIRVELGKHRVEFAQAHDRRAVGYIGAVVASGLQLAGAQDPFKKDASSLSLMVSARGRVRADERWMRDWNSLLLQSASRILDPASHAGIFLTEHPVGKDQQRARDCKSFAQTFELFS